MLLAHVGRPVAPHDLLSAWSFEPAVLAGLVLAGWLYWRGAARLWSSAGAGQVVGPRRAGAFLTGLGVIALALLTPLDVASGALFSAHMVQHLLLMLVAPPLLLIGTPGKVLSRALPPRWRRRFGRWQGRLARAGRSLPALPIAALAVFVVVVAFWHLPVAYDAAVASELVHIGEHATMLAAGCAFWWPAISARHAPAWVGLLVVFAGAVVTGLVAALLTFAPTAWYDAHQISAPLWGLSALEDQQLAGVIMWVPGGTVYLFAGGLVFVRWLDEDERSARRFVSQLSRDAGHAR